MSATDTTPATTPTEVPAEAPTPTSGTDRSWRRVLALPLIWPIRVYQLLISPMTPPSCRFYPCCSSYAVTALERFGPIRGSWLTLRRLARCHPWNPGGVDHVPERATFASVDRLLPRK